MKKRAYLVVFVLVFVSLACSPLQNFFDRQPLGEAQ
jgi:hypothetical protein